MLFPIAGFCLLSTHLSAALPPFYQSLKEYKALINGNELPMHLDPSDLITDITRNDDVFIVTTSKHQLKVDVVYDPPEHQGFVGPARFHLVFHEREALSES